MPPIKPTSIMLYGNSGCTKTSQTYHLVKMIHKRTGKKVRIVHSDGGGYAPFVDSGMVDKGIVEVFDYSNREHALADLRKLSEGYWPRWVKDGQAHPNYVEGATEYFRKEQVCMTTPQEWSQIGGYVIDGMTSTAEVLKSHCSNQETGVGFNAAWKYEEEGYTILGLQQGHYNIVQKEIYDRHIKGFATLPTQWLIWTALVGKGEDKQSRVTVYGPQVVGNASTPQVPAWFNHCFHLSKERYQNVRTKLPEKLSPFPPNGQEVEGYVAWFQQHSESSNGMEGIPYLCKTTMLPELYMKLLEYFPMGFVPLGIGNGINLLFEILEIEKKKMFQTKEEK